MLRLFGVSLAFLWRLSRRCEVYAERLALALIGGNGDAKDTLGGHRMTAGVMFGEEVTGASPCALIEGYGMGVVLSTEGRLKMGELDALWFLRVLLGFGDLPNHA